MKRLLLLSLIAIATTVATYNVNAAPIPDGRIDAFTKTSPAGAPVVDNFACVNLGDGNLLIAFTVTGIGRWDCMEVCTGNQVKFLASGIANYSGEIHYCVMPAADYVNCYFETYNVHGWAGPEL